MGSSFSIVNNTRKPIWVKDGVCHAALWGSIGGVLVVATAAAAAGAYAAGVAGAAVVAAANLIKNNPLVAILTAAGVTAARAKAIGTVSRVLSFTARHVKGLSREEEQEVLSLKAQLEKELEDFTRVDPGCKYTVNGTLSLVKTVHVIYDDYTHAKRDCWTASTDGGERLYLVTEYF